MTTAAAPADPSARTGQIVLALGAITVLVGAWRPAVGQLAGVPLIVIGCGMVLVGAFFDRIKSWKVGPSGFAGELFERPQGAELVQAAAPAPDSALAAVMPLLRE